MIKTILNKKHTVWLILLLLFALISGCTSLQSIVSSPRRVLTYNDLMNGFDPPAPVDNAYLAMPVGAAEPENVFEGRLELIDEASIGRVTFLRGETMAAEVEHLPEFDFEFVQSGTYLIPVQRGLIITSHPYWDYILEPGRVWQEATDQGASRASIPFFLVPRGSSSTRNGVMTFLFNETKISNVYYQITQETTTYVQADFWGLLDATYHTGPVAGASNIRQDFEQELASRIPTRPIEQLAKDYPGVDVSHLIRNITPEHITTYGLIVNGIHYRSACTTRYGEYPYCDFVRMPSFSTAKSAFISVALMRMTQKYGPQVPDLLIRDYVPEAAQSRGDWSQVTFNNTLDMATGNYTTAEFMVDEEGRIFEEFFVLDAYDDMIAVAFDWPHSAPPGTQWVYRSSDTFILAAAMQNYLRSIEGPGADLFDFVVQGVYIPIGIGPGAFSTLRTSDDDWHGLPLGAMGVWWIPDDIAKLGIFLNEARGTIGGEQILDPGLLAAALQADPNDRGLNIPGGKYNNAFWAAHFTPADGFTCEFYVPYMAGYSGNIVALIPNGVTFYYFSDNRDFNWYSAVFEADKIVPICPTDN